MEKVDKEKLWLDRLREAILKSKKDYYCSWWLRLDFEDEGVTTTKINYWLNKSVAKNKLKKTTNKQYTKYFIA